MKRVKRRKLLAVLLAAVMMFGMVPTAAFAADNGQDGLCVQNSEDTLECDDAQATEGESCQQEASPVDSVSEVPEVSETPEVNEAPEVSETPEVSEAPEVSETPEVSEVPEVSETPEVSEAPEVSETPEVSEAPEISEVPEVSEAPEVQNAEEVAPEVSETPEVQNAEEVAPEVSEAPEVQTARALGTGHLISVKVYKVVLDDSKPVGYQTPLELVGTVEERCIDQYGHSGPNHAMRLKWFHPKNFGLSTENWKGWQFRATFNPKEKIFDTFYDFNSSTVDAITTVSGSEPYQCSKEFYLVYGNPAQSYDYAIYYNTQGGSTVAPTTQSSTATSVTLNVTDKVPTREGYTFKGWSETADSTSADAKSSYTLTSVAPTKTLYAVWSKNPVLPEKPTDDWLIENVKNAVQLRCTNENASHEDKTYDLINGTFEVGDVSSSNDGYTCVVTITDPQPYVTQYNIDIAADHVLDPADQGDKTITLRYENDAWMVISTLPVVYTMMCKTLTDWGGLTVEKKADKTTVKPGEEITYTITVKNNTGKTLTDVTVSDKLDSNLTFVSADNNGINTNGTVTWVIDSLADGATKELKLVAKVSNNVTDKTDIKNTATITDATDSDNGKLPEDNKPDGSTDITVDKSSVTPPATETDWSKLTVSKTVNKTTVKPGEEITYTITVKNNTGKALTDVTVSDKLDSNLTFVSADNDGKNNDGTVTWVIASLAAGETKELKLVVKVSDSVTDKTVIKNTATITDAADPDDGKLPEDNKPDGSTDITIDNESGDNKPGDNKPGDNKPGDNTSGDNKPGDNKPGDSKPGDNTSGDNKPGDSKPNNSKSGHHSKHSHHSSSDNNNTSNDSTSNVTSVSTSGDNTGNPMQLSTSPKTGDTSQTVLWMSLLAISLLGLGAMFLMWKKKTYQDR